jgi:uncharacterized protein
LSKTEKMASRVKFLTMLNAFIVLGLLVLLFFHVKDQNQVSSLSIVAGQHGVAFAGDDQQPELSEPINNDLSSHFKRSHAPRVQSVEREQLSGRIALVIDDLGFSFRSSTVQGMLNLPIPLTAGVIPSHIASEAIAIEANRLGHEVIAHVPMEPMNHPGDTEPDYLHSSLSFAEFSSFMESVEAIPFANGMSNHQGSLATQDPELMRRVAGWCSQRGWFVLDSITHASTLLYRSARAQGVPAVRRDLFLDHHQEPDSIRARLHDAVQMATEQDGIVIVIAHPRESTLAVLRAELPQLLEQGVDFVRLSDGFEPGTTTFVTGEER